MPYHFYLALGSATPQLDGFHRVLRTHVLALSATKEDKDTGIRTSPITCLVPGERLMIWVPLHDDIRPTKRCPPIAFSPGVTLATICKAAVAERSEMFRKARHDGLRQDRVPVVTPQVQRQHDLGDGEETAKDGGGVQKALAHIYTLPVLHCLACGGVRTHGSNGIPPDRRATNILYLLRSIFTIDRYTTDSNTRYIEALRMKIRY